MVRSASFYKGGHRTQRAYKRHIGKQAEQKTERNIGRAKRAPLSGISVAQAKEIVRDEGDEGRSMREAFRFLAQESAPNRAHAIVTALPAQSVAATRLADLSPTQLELVATTAITYHDLLNNYPDLLLGKGVEALANTDSKTGRPALPT